MCPQKSVQHEMFNSCQVIHVESVHSFYKKPNQAMQTIRIIQALNRKIIRYSSKNETVVVVSIKPSRFMKRTSENMQSKARKTYPSVQKTNISLDHCNQRWGVEGTLIAGEKVVIGECGAEMREENAGRGDFHGLTGTLMQLMF